MTQALAGFFVYYVVFLHNGFYPLHLFGIQIKWNDKSLNDLEDSFGQEWVRFNSLFLPTPSFGEKTYVFYP